MSTKTKTLLGALAATAAVTTLALSAEAADRINLRLEGYMEQWLGLADQAGGFEAANGKRARFDQQSDTEVHVAGETTLDNGIKLSVHMEFEADEGAGGVDQSWLDVDSRFGLLRLGGAPNVLEESHRAAPDVGIGNQDGDYMNWIIQPDAFVDNATTYFGNGKTNRLNYWSPAFHGFQVAASYIPDAVNPNNPTVVPSRTDGAQKAYSYALLYAGRVGGVEIAADLGFGKAFRTPVTTGQHVYQVGVNIGYGGFVLGGSFMDINEKHFVTTTSAKGNAYDVGLSYESGPYAASLTWFHSTAEGDLADPGKDRKSSLMLSGAYNLGPGVDLKGSLFYVKYDDETADPANSNKGVGGVGGLVLSF